MKKLKTKSKGTFRIGRKIFNLDFDPSRVDRRIEELIARRSVLQDKIAAINLELTQLNNLSD